MVWQACEDFSVQEQIRYQHAFSASVSEILRGRRLSKLDILEAAKPCFTADEQKKLWKPRNLPMSRQLIGRALYELEEKGVIGWDKTVYYLNQ